MRVLVLGASGMLGNAVFRILNEKQDWIVYGTVRSGDVKKFFSPELRERILVGCDVNNQDALVQLIGKIRPQVIINCISLAKPLLTASDPLEIIPIYALLPHRLAGLCSLFGARLVHISTDGVFTGSKGQYTEDDFPDARDIYGVSKILGEVNYPHTISLRTSFIGHELQGENGLLGWFLSRQESCKCFSRAIFSGLPTVVIAQIIRDFVIPQASMYGVYHVAAQPISKFDLLGIVAEKYGKSIEIIPVDEPVIDRSLNADRFRAATGYAPPDWPELINIMHSYK